MKTTSKLYLDFETYSEADLKTIGAWAYSKHPSTEVLMAGYALNDDAPAIWLPGDPEPGFVGRIREYSAGIDNLPFQIVAWYLFFELSIMTNVLKWPVLAPRYYADAAAKAAALALPRTLDGAGVALGLGVDAAKDKAGKNLINIFSKPKASMKKATRGQLIRTRPQDEPKLFNDFKNYCKRDIVAERNIDKLLPELQDRTRELWELDLKINLRGVRFDMPAVHNAIATVAKARKIADQKISDATAGLLENISSRNQFLGYMEILGVNLENAQKEYLKRTVKQLDKDVADAQILDQDRGRELAHAAEIIKLRLEVSRSSLAKYDKLTGIVDDSDRAYGLLRFHGASTGRFSGNLFQPQNLPRKSLDLPDLCIELLQYRDPEMIELLFDNCLRAISLCLRGMITASPGNRLVVSDFAQIESRVLAWLAGDLSKLQAYIDRLDIYKVNAAAAFKVGYDDVTKEQRQIGKVIELACGYQGALGAFQEFSKVYEVVIPDDDAKRLINNWRKANPKITSYWNNIEAAAVKAVAEPGSIQKIRNVGYRMVGSGNRSFLFCILPSGRRIAYHKPRLIESKFDKYQVEYMGVNSMTKKYTRQRTYGGKLVENITQATAADCMIDKMIEIDAAGYPLVLTVHDELVADTPQGRGSLDE
jgi:DNA polymerase